MTYSPNNYEVNMLVGLRDDLFTYQQMFKSSLRQCCYGVAITSQAMVQVDYTSVRFLHHLRPAALDGVNHVETFTSVCNLFLISFHSLIVTMATELKLIIVTFVQARRKEVHVQCKGTINARNQHSGTFIMYVATLPENCMNLACLMVYLYYIWQRGIHVH